MTESKSTSVLGSQTGLADESVAVAELVWPPRSPHEVLMSSPSGRRKLQEMQNRRRDARSSSRAQQLLDGDAETGDREEYDEDDEETLHLKLAAIEARLKLKRLQQNKARLKPSSSDIEGGDTRSRPSSIVGSTASRPPSRFLVERKRKIADITHQDTIQVPL